MKKKVNAINRKYTTITIPTALFGKIKEQISNTGFSSVSDYATYVLREITADAANKKSGKKRNTSEVIEKLSSLGYI
jgi:Arc/MetJ-type ribon-helix-helix transcriptional regulator